MIGPIAECRRAMFLACLLIGGRSKASRRARTKALSWQMVFPGLSESFATGLPLHSTSLITILSGLTCGRSQVKRVPIPKLSFTREAKWRYRSTALAVEIVGEDQHFAQRIDTQLLIMGDSFFSPFHRVAGIVAQPLIAGGEFRTEIAQERIHSDAVGQRDAQLVGILFQPGGRAARWLLARLGLICWWAWNHSWAWVPIGVKFRRRARS